jgi:hypothetical protein
VGEKRRKPGIGARIGVAVLTTMLLVGGVVLATSASARPTGRETNRDAVYGTSKPPTATTNAATGVTSSSATFNGVVGPGLTAANTPEVTSYVFEYGKATTYGSQSSSGSVSSTKAVFATPGGLTPCTTYHFRLVASAASGTADGNDQSVTTAFANPISGVKSPRKVKHKHRFKITFTVSSPASVTVVITHKGHVVKTLTEGTRDGAVAVKIKAPRKKGKYGIRIVATESCGQQTVSKQLKVR